MDEQKTFEEIKTGNIKQFEVEGDEIEGVLTKKVPGRYESSDYLIKAPSGEDFTIFGCTVLETKMRSVEEGIYVKITFLGEVKSDTGRMYKDFKVEVAK